MSSVAATLPDWVEGVRAHVLLNGHAMGLRPTRDAVLRVRSGRVWVTTGGPYSGAFNEWGDRFMVAGEALTAPAGALVVLEAWAECGAPERTEFEWFGSPTQARRPLSSALRLAPYIAALWREAGKAWPQLRARTGGAGQGAVAVPTPSSSCAS